MKAAPPVRVSAAVARACLGALGMLAALTAAPSTASAVSEASILAETPPKLLSEFRFFDDAARQVPASGLMPYALNTPLFSDGAEKYRFVHVPAGATATYNPDEAFEFPVGTALVKTFAFPADRRHPEQDVRLIETRVLLRHENGWKAWAYLWNDAQSDAVLKITGAQVDIKTITPDGSALSFIYSVPNKNQCKGCHAFNSAITPLGPKARNLNRSYDYAGGRANQLAHWTEAGILDGAPPAAGCACGGRLARPGIPRGRAGPRLARRKLRPLPPARGCGAAIPASFSTSAEQDRVHRGVSNGRSAAGRGAGDKEFDIKPGDPDGSIMVYRVESTEPGVMMPELGRHIADPKAVIAAARLDRGSTLVPC